MASSPRSSVKRKPYGPNIVRAWFDTVFPFALRGLENERGFLVRKNWTFRFWNRKLEYISPFAEHIPAAARDNLEQVVSFFPKLGARIGEHDACLSQLQKSCGSYLVALVESRDFQKVFLTVANEASHASGRAFAANFGAYTSEEDFKGILAEYLVNNVETLPSHYSTADIWNLYRDRFAKLQSVRELAARRAATVKSGDAMLTATNDLTAELKSTRSELSLEFDVPYVAELNSVR